MMFLLVASSLSVGKKMYRVSIDAHVIISKTVGKYERGVFHEVLYNLCTQRGWQKHRHSPPETETRRNSMKLKKNYFNHS